MKYQGGYQIIDLSGGDIFAKAKSAFETNKPVLVYDGGIASFGNVIKSSTNFVINYIIDDKLYQATIAANNTVSKTSIDLGDSSSDVQELKETVEALTSPAVYQYDSSVSGGGVNLNVSTYTQASPFTAPKRGYITVISGTTDPIMVSNPVDDSYYTIIGLSATTSANENCITLPVEKGQELFVNNAPVSGSAIARYMPY